MNTLRIFILGSLLLVFHLSKAQAPKDTTLYKIILKDGMTFIGNIVERDSQTIHLITQSQTKLEIQSVNIVSITAVKNGERSGWPDNPNPTRYLFGPSAFQLKRGSGYYHNTFIFLNSFNYGLTDNISLGGGIELISTLITLANGEFSPILIFTPKAAVEVRKNIRLGGGVIYAAMLNFKTGGSEGVGIAYGVGTLGTEDHNLTLGLGSGFTSGEFQTNPFITFSGTTRIAKNISLVTENWMIPISGGYYTINSGGIRFYSGKISADMALITNKDFRDVFVLGIPYVDFMYKF